VPPQDYLDSMIGLVGSSNTLQTQWSYGTFGAPFQSGASSAYPFLFGGAQFDPTGYYGSFNPTMAHSVSGGAVPYTGAAAPEFGSMSGRVPHSLDRATRAATREDASQAALSHPAFGDGGGGGGAFEKASIRHLTESS
jgi:hypothetical protein